jgi:hypothetical protein
MAFLNTLSTSYLSPLKSSSQFFGAALDEFGQDALFGYSLRKIKDDADKCIRVIRGDGDNVEQDIGFTEEGAVDIDAIINFAGPHPCYVKVWYNQLLPEATIHLASSVESQQPLVSDGIDHIWSTMTDTWSSSEDNYGYILIDVSNNLLYLSFRSGRYLEFIETNGSYEDSSGWSVATTSLDDDYGVYFLGESKKTTGTSTILSADSNNDRFELYDNRIQYYVNGTVDSVALNNDGFNNLYLWELSRNSSDGLISYRNDTYYITGSVTSSGSFELEKVGDGFDGNVYEFIGYEADPVQQRKGFFLSLNDYYNLVIFQAADIDGLPTITGSPEVGQVLTATLAPSNGYPIPVDTLQWQVSNSNHPTQGWSDIPGETSSTYTITSGDDGKYIRVEQSSVNNRGSNKVASIPVSI